MFVGEARPLVVINRTAGLLWILIKAKNSLDADPKVRMRVEPMTFGFREQRLPAGPPRPTSVRVHVRTQTGCRIKEQKLFVESF